MKRRQNSDDRVLPTDFAHLVHKEFSRRELLALLLKTGVAGGASAFVAACGATPLTESIPITPAPRVAPTATMAEKLSNRVIVGFTQEPTVFNPLMPSIEVDKGIHYNVFDTLWGVDETGNYFPNLAREVPSVANGGISDDGLIWTIHLRDDVKWHDGQPFTAEDVRFTLELITRDDFKAASRQGHDLITEIDVVNPTEITWEMSESYAPYLAVLATTFIVPEHILGSEPDPNTADFNNSPIGTGAYVWGDRVAGDRITLTGNPEYFREGPHIEDVVIRYIPDLTVFYTQFKTGEIDYTGTAGITPDNYSDAIGLADREIYVTPSPALENIWFNLGLPQFQEKAVRQALYYAMDKEAIINDINYGLPEAAESYLPKQSWAHNPDLPRHEYDPDKAIEILEAAGWSLGADGIREKNGVRLQFTNSTTAGNKVREQAQAYLQQNWREIGVQMEINNLPAAVVWGDYWSMSQFETVMVGLRYIRAPDPDPINYFHEDYIPAQGGSGGNYMQYRNSELSELLEAAATTVDMDKRKEYYYRIQEIIRDELPFLPIYRYVEVEGTKEGLAGFTPNPNVVINTWNIHEWHWEDQTS
jgi:peptide/nickel transport system substrate-binding protein